MKNINPSKDNLPLIFSGSHLKVNRVNRSFFSGILLKKIKFLHPDAKVFIFLAGSGHNFFNGNNGKTFGLIYAVSFFRQLTAERAGRVLDGLKNIGCGDFADWTEDAAGKNLRDLIVSIKNKFSPKIKKDDLETGVKLHDEIVRRSRGLRIGIEVSKGNGNILKFISRNESLLEVILGIRCATLALVPESKIDSLKNALWALRQIEGIAINNLKLSQSKYYFYDEYRLKKTAKDNGLNLGVTTQGLEHLIKLDMARKKGIFVEISKARQNKEMGKMLAISKAIFLREPSRKFVIWDNNLCIWRAGELAQKVFELEKSKIEAIYMATINREKIFKSQLETEVENHLIFNRRVPIVIIDDSEESVLAANKKALKYLRRKYQTCFIHITPEDREKEFSWYASKLTGIYQKAVDKNFLERSLKNVLESNGILFDNKVNEKKMAEYLKRNVFNHISGVRNRTVLRAKRESVIMNTDDDAPAETYVLERKSREKELSKRKSARKKAIKKMLEEFSFLAGIKVVSERQFYKVLARESNSVRLKEFIKKYFGYESESDTGIVPGAVEEIKKYEKQLLDDDGWGNKLGITQQRYQGLMNPLAGYMLNISDFIYIKPRIDKTENKFTVMPVDVFSPAKLIGQKAKNTGFPLMRKDLRGTMAEPIFDKESKIKVGNKKIAYVAFPFVGDQDTSGVSQFIRYLQIKHKKLVNMQHVNQSAVVLNGVGGFIGDVFVIFNRSILDNSIISPTIGRDLRLEEPPFIVWVKSPMMGGKGIVAYSPVGGGQQRAIEERMYDIARQDYTEIAGAMARAAYETAVKNFYSDLNKYSEFKKKNKAYERLKLLGIKYLKESKAFKLDTGQINDILQQRLYRAGMISDLGLERGRKASKLNKHFCKKGALNAEKEIRDIDFVIIQYAVSFGMYDIKEESKDSYEPLVKGEDYFYRLTADKTCIHWQAVRPNIKILTKKGVKETVSSEWVAVRNMSGLFLKSFWEPGKPIETEPGKRIILSRLPEIGEKAIVPVISSAKEKPFLERMHKKIIDQIKADGELMLVWPDLVENALSWREYLK